MLKEIDLKSLAILVLRIAIGLGIASHGAMVLLNGQIDGFSMYVAKLGFPAPLFFAYMAKLSEMVGGVFLALGLLTRPSALFISITMGVAAFIAHADAPIMATPGQASKEMALLYFIPAVSLLISGAGVISIDRIMQKLIDTKKCKLACVLFGD